eukprot:6763701-Lingulodinium_polyedra.AAC.1
MAVIAMVVVIALSIWFLSYVFVVCVGVCIHVESSLGDDAGSNDVGGVDGGGGGVGDDYV